MPRYAIVIDVTKCNGCYNCFLSCRDEYCGNEYPKYSLAQPLHDHFWLQMQEVERGVYPKPKLSYIPQPCQHCESAPCIDAAKDGAVYRRKDGIVMIDPEKAVGQQRIVNACPYRVISWNEEKQVPQKCTMCAHRLDEGEKEPRCVEACPTGAMVFGDLDDPNSAASKLAKSAESEALHPEYQTQPLIRYIGLPKRFIAGEVVFADKTGECAKGVKVTLSGGGQTCEVQTDIYGDFEFEGLEKNTSYTLGVAADGYQPRELKCTTHRDVNLGEIVLDCK
ncbi:MAG: 4Fe-4S dicluster domain-containing protein [Desulfopila sp.]